MSSRTTLVRYNTDECLFNCFKCSFLSCSLLLTTGSESECIGHFKLLFSLLRVHGAGRVQQLVLEVELTNSGS